MAFTRSRALVPIVYSSVMGDYSLMVIPFIVGAMMAGYGVSPALAGQAVSVQYFAMAASFFSTPWLMRSVSPRHSLGGMLIALAASNIVCLLGSGAFTLLAAQACVGFTEGSLMAIAGALAAGLRRPDRAYSAISLAVAGIGATALVTTPMLISVAGPRAIFAFMAGFSLLGLLFVPLAPDHAAAPAAPSEAAASVKRDHRDRINSTLTLLSYLLISAGGSGLWVFAQRIGTFHGYSIERTGSYLAIGQVLGIVGPLLLALFVSRSRYLPLFVIPSIINIVCAFTFVAPAYGWGFALSATLVTISFTFLTPCYRTLMAAQDKSGKIVALSISMFALGSGLSPMVISLVVGSRPDFGTIGILCASFYGLALALIIIPALAAGRVMQADISGSGPRLGEAG